jgi:hypothetical protein
LIATPAASNSRRVNRETATRRSKVLIFWSFPEPNGMLSWRGPDGCGNGGTLRILLLLDDGCIARRASSDSLLGQQPMQLGQRRYGHARCAQRHSGAGGRVEHPRGHDDDHAGRRFDVNELAAGAPLRVLSANTPPIQCVPAVTDLNVLPDMGRMTARLLWAARISYSPVRMRAGRRWQTP